ncbi:MAG: DUF1963 domain-containing protein [Chloroflexi bacterium]|nr:DUF1963 domain-containing protein [Chloroflexota bacterium]
MKRYRITFRQAPSPIADPVTKFGGQPTWVNTPTWPLSRSTGQPMLFIGQVALDPAFAGDGGARMAYIFMTDLLDKFVDDTWDPNGGENAVVLQPGSYEGPFSPAATGPTLYRMVRDEAAGELVPEPCELAVQLEAEEEAAPADETDESLLGNKIGGTPGWIQEPEYPDDSTSWRLLLQLDSTDVPFYLNFGDAGIGYVFLSEDGPRAGFLWQCS